MTHENESDWIIPPTATDFKTSDSLNELAAALAKAQGVMSPAVKNTKNPYFKSSYADLGAVMDVVRKPFADNGLSIIQGPFTTEQGRVVVRTRLLHASGQWIECAISAEPKDMGAQSAGSVITYLRRYGLSAMAGVSTEDDDGEAGEARGQASATANARATHAPAAAPSAAKPIAKPVTTDSILGGRTESAGVKRGPRPTPVQRSLEDSAECEHGVSIHQDCHRCADAHAAARG